MRDAGIIGKNRKKITGCISVLGLLIGMILIARIYNMDRIAGCMLGTWTENESAWPVFTFRRDMTAEHVTPEKGRHEDLLRFAMRDKRQLAFILLDQFGDWCGAYHLVYIDPYWMGYRVVDDYGNPGETQWLFKTHNPKWYIDPALAESFGNEYWELIECDRTDFNEISEFLEFHYNVHSREYWLIKTYTARQKNDPSQVINSRPWYGTVVMKNGTLRIYENPWKYQKFRYRLKDDTLELVDASGRKAVYQRHYRRGKPASGE